MLAVDAMLGNLIFDLSTVVAAQEGRVDSQEVREVFWLEAS